MIRIPSYLYREVYEDLYGECFDKNGNEIVIVSIPDDSGVNVENSDGVEIFISSEDGIFLSEDQYKRIR